MADHDVQYPHQSKSDEACDTATAKAEGNPAVEATGRGLFDFLGKKEEEKKKCEGEVIATEFEEKVQVSEEKKKVEPKEEEKKKHESLAEKLHRSSSSSSSVSFPSTHSILIVENNLYVMV